MLVRCYSDARVQFYGFVGAKFLLFQCVAVLDSLFAASYVHCFMVGDRASAAANEHA
jgi:hypothetical protein